MIKKVLISLLVVSTIFASGCGELNNTSSQNASPAKILRAKTENSEVKTAGKKVEIFDLAKNKANISFYKTAIATSESEVYVSPETTGKVIQVNVKIGDEVKKGQTLIVLGDSVATQIADIQSNTTAQSLELAKQSQTLTNKSAEQTWKMTYLGTEIARESFANSATSKRDAQDLYEEQVDSAEIALDMAENAYDAAKEAVEVFDDLPPEQQQQMSLSGDVDAAKESAEDGVKQAENAIDITEKSFNSQIHQLDFAIQVALDSYRLAIDQLEMAQIGMGQQQIGASLQVLQAESGSQIAQISANSKYIKAPIDGVVTSISAEKGNILSPSMTALKVENSQKLSLNAALNSYEASLVRVGEKVKVEADEVEAKGEIISISPSLDAMTKKINIKILINDPKEITPGSITKVYFTPSISGTIFIPLNSVYNAENEQYVKIVENEKIAYRKVKMGEITDDFVEITEGLKGDEKVVTSSELFLDEGEKVTILIGAKT